MDGFIAYLRDDCHCSDSTIACYLSDLRRLESWFGGRLETVDTHDLDAYAEHLKTTYMPATVARKVSAIRRYYFWLRRDDLAEHLRPGTPERKEKETLSQKQFTSLLARINQMDRPTRHRDKWMVAQIVNGLSLKEACREYSITRQGLHKALRHYGVTPQMLVNTYRRGMK